MGIFGVSGELRVFVPDGGLTDLAGALDVTLVAPDGSERPARMSLRAGGGRRVLARVEGLEDREEARALMGWRVEIDRSAARPLAEGEWWVRDLLGLPVHDENGRLLGRLVEVHASGGIDVWEIHGASGEVYYLPAFRDRIVSVDAARVVVREALALPDEV